MRRGVTRSACALVLGVLSFGGELAHASDPWIDVVRRFTPGEFAGFGQQSLPWIVLGPPVPGGPIAGSTHVVSLGNGGSIEVLFRDNLVVDGPGADLVIFENAFHIGSPTGNVFTEFAFVEVSRDGLAWHRFPFDAETGAGLAGATPVLAEPSDPFDPAVGGDRFDIGELGLDFVRYVRLIDAGDEVDDVGNHVAPANQGGFDLDAMGALSSTSPAVVSGVVSHAGQPVAHAVVHLEPVDGGRTKRRRSDGEGRFAFSNVIPSGDYRVSARRRHLGRAEAFVFVDLEQLEVDADMVLSKD